MSKKILSVVLALVLVMSTFALSAFAASKPAYEEEPSEYTQAWRLEDASEGDVYKANIYLKAEYGVGAVQFKIESAGKADLKAVDSDVFVGDYDINFSKEGLVFIVPTPAEGTESMDAIEFADETLIATLTFELAEGADSATVSIENAPKNEENPDGTLVAARVDDGNLVTGTSIVGQEVTAVEGSATFGAAPADLAVKSAYASAGIVIDNAKTLNKAYAGVVYGLPLVADDTGKVGTTSLTVAYYTERFEATNGGTLTVKQTPYIKRPAAYGTGTTLIVTGADGTTKTYVVVIFGDVDGDSKIDTTDVAELLAASKVSDTFADSVKRLACNVAIAGRGMSASNHYNISTDDLGAVLGATKTGNGKFVNGAKNPDQAELAASHNSYNTYYQ